MTLYLVISIASFLISALTLFSGFGLGTLLLPTFALFFPVNLAIAATAIVHLANNVFKFFLVGKMADWRVTLRFSGPAVVSAALGAWLLSRIGKLSPLASYRLFGHEFEVEPVKLVIGALIAAFSVFELIPSLKKISLPPKFIPLGGLVSGFFGGLSGLQGALRSMFLIRAGLTKDQFVGTTVSSAILVDISRIAVYGYAMFGAHLESLKDQGVIYPVVAAILAALAGSILSSQLLKKTTLKTIQKIVGTFLLLTSIALMGGLV